MLSQFIDIILHLDAYLIALTQQYGILIYAILFLIIFAETGLIVTPFLPGDSLLFAVGAVASLEGSQIQITTVWLLLIFAAFLGDNTNYQIGRFIGPKVFKQKKSLFFNPENLHRTHAFYERYGRRTVFFARFMPIFRTFAPFVAGVGGMRIRDFMMFSLVGSFVWMSTFLGAGYYFGNIPKVKENFHIVIFSVIIISFLPVIIGYLKRSAKPT